MVRTSHKAGYATTNCVVYLIRTSGRCPLRGSCRAYRFLCSPWFAARNLPLSRRLLAGVVSLPRAETQGQEVCWVPMYFSVCISNRRLAVRSNSKAPSPAG